MNRKIQLQNLKKARTVRQMNILRNRNAQPQNINSSPRKRFYSRGVVKVPRQIPLINPLLLIGVNPRDASPRTDNEMPDQSVEFGEVDTARNKFSNFQRSGIMSSSDGMINEFDFIPQPFRRRKK